MSDDHDFDFEPLPGLPARLPEGERLIWRGSPEPMALAARAFRLRLVGGYFAALAGWQAAGGVASGASSSEIASALSWTATLAATTIAILAVLGWLIAKNTIYTVTSRRIILRHGVAMPMAINIPFVKINTAAHRPRAGSTGDIAFELAPGNRIFRLLLWPHVRPGRYLHAQPALSSIHDADRVAGLIGAALADSARRERDEALVVPTASTIPPTHAAGLRPAAARVLQTTARDRRRLASDTVTAS